MRAPVLGIVVGGILGLLDGLSAWFYPEARDMMIAIVLGSTIKGVLTGLAAGLVARWRQSLILGVATGVVVGFFLSTLAALGQSDHYWAIVLPGMLVGLITGFATQRPRRTVVLVALCLIPATILAQSTPANAPLSPLDPFIGRWQGTSEGQPGKGTQEREYKRILNSRFVEATNRAVYPPQERNPKGETHEDMGIFSFDRSRKQIVFRQFHVEGFVTQYVQQPTSPDGKIVFESESLENIGKGWRARETYTFFGADEFEEVFELAGPEKPFEVYSRARLKRVK